MSALKKLRQQRMAEEMQKMREKEIQRRKAELKEMKEQSSTSASAQRSKASKDEAAYDNEDDAVVVDDDDDSKSRSHSFRFASFTALNDDDDMSSESPGNEQTAAVAVASDDVDQKTISNEKSLSEAELAMRAKKREKRLRQKASKAASTNSSNANVDAANTSSGAENPIESKDNVVHLKKKDKMKGKKKVGQSEVLDEDVDAILHDLDSANELSVAAAASSSSNSHSSNSSHSFAFLCCDAKAFQIPTAGVVRRSRPQQLGLIWNPKRTVLLQPPAAAFLTDAGGEYAQPAAYFPAFHLPTIQFLPTSDERLAQIRLTPADRAFGFQSNSAEFTAMQNEYSRAVSNIETLLAFVNDHPYHPHACLKLAAICEAQDQHFYARVYLARGLYALESSIPASMLLASRFSSKSSPPLLFSAQLRMSDSESLNSVFFQILAKYAKLLSRSGAHRAALEVTKLLLSLSPLQDPLGTLFSIDYHALRSSAFQFLLDLMYNLDLTIHEHLDSESPWIPLGDFSSANFKINKPLPRLPCIYLPILYSAAIAKYCLESRDFDGSALDSPLPAFPLLFPAAVHSFHKLTATQILHHAILFFPELVPELLTRAGAAKLLEFPDPNSANSDSISMAAKFNSLHPPASGYVKTLMDIYVSRSFQLWKNDELSAWLAYEALNLLSAIDEKKVDSSHFVILRQMVFNTPMPAALQRFHGQRHLYTDEAEQIDPAMFQRRIDDNAFGGDRAELQDAMARAAGYTPLNIEQLPPARAAAAGGEGVSPLSIDWERWKTIAWMFVISAAPWHVVLADAFDQQHED